MLGLSAQAETATMRRRRKVYDQTGSLADSEELAGEQFDALREYFRTLYKQVTVEDIEELEGQFRGSPEEAGELLELHERFKGDMGKVAAPLCALSLACDTALLLAPARTSLTHRAAGHPLEVAVPWTRAPAAA